MHRTIRCGNSTVCSSVEFAPAPATQRTLVPEMPHLSVVGASSGTTRSSVGARRVLADELGEDRRQAPEHLAHRRARVLVRLLPSLGVISYSGPQLGGGQREAHEDREGDEQAGKD